MMNQPLNLRFLCLKFVALAALIAISAKEKAMAQYEGPRYESPTIAGFSLGTSFGDDEESAWDSAALRYAGEFGAFRVASKTKFLTGEVDRGMVNLPVKLDFAGTFQNIPGYHMDDAKYHGWEQDVEVPMSGLGQKYNVNGLSLQLGVKWGRSSYDAGGISVDTRNSGADASALLDPAGLAGDFGGGGLAFPNIMYFANHGNIWATSIYEEQLYTVGAGKTCFEDDKLTVRSSAAVLYGNTKEGVSISGQTGFVGMNNPTVDYHYQNELKTSRYGFQLGAGLSYDIGELGGNAVTLYLDGKIRYIYNDADGMSMAQTQGLVNAQSSNYEIGRNWSDFGFVGEAGISIELNESTTFSVGVHAETWEVGTLVPSANLPFLIDDVDRTSVTTAFAIEVKF